MNTWKMKKLPFKASRALVKYHKFDLDDAKLVKLIKAYDKVRQDWWDAAPERAVGGPPEGPEKDALDAAWAARAEVEHSRKAKSKALWEKVSEKMKDQYNAARKDHWYRDVNSKPLEEKVSPCGKYKLVVTSHQTGRGSWAYTKGIVSLVETGVVIEEIRRNYSSFLCSWIEHANGHDYLVCGASYMGQTIVELDTGKRVDENGDSFCWITHHPNADGTLLAVEGCYWGASYEIMIFDFSEPLSPPWPLLCRSDYDTFHGWTSLTVCEYGRAGDRVNVPGHPLHGKFENDMILEEMEVIETLAQEQGKVEEDLYEWGVIEEHEWERPSDQKAFEQFVDENVSFHKKKWDENPDDVWAGISRSRLRMLETLVARADVKAAPEEIQVLFNWALNVAHVREKY